jgi:hypothetical protein
MRKPSIPPAFEFIISPGTATLPALIPHLSLLPATEIPFPVLRRHLQLSFERTLTPPAIKLHFERAFDLTLRFLSTNFLENLSKSP